jgi:formylmethanofuran dehydrogenase subunit E
MSKVEDLEKEFPELFKHSCWVECGDGWAGILHQLCVDLTELNKKLPEEEKIWFSQIKEKWGVLRIYIYGWCEKANSLINAAEKLSGQICEKCGEPGKQSADTYWVKTLCSNCKQA